MIKVLVLGAGGPAGINFIKALKIGGITSIFGADSNPYHVILSEKSTIRSFKIPKYNEKGYIDAINRIIEIYEIDFVHAQSDNEVLQISYNRDKIKAKTFLPPHTTIRYCQDKWLTSTNWTKYWPDAMSHTIKDSETLFKYLAQLITKWGPLWIRATSGAGGRGSTLCMLPSQGYHWLKYWWSRDSTMEFMVQKYLSGRNIAWQSVWKNGVLLTSQARERVEYIYPNLAPSGITGTPTVQRTLNESKIDKAAVIAVTSVHKNPNGVYGVDLKENENGEPISTEINCGRFFTTSYFFAYAGVMFNNSLLTNMPYVYVMNGLDKYVPYGKNYNVLDKGIYWIRHIDCGHKLTKEDCITR